MRRQIPAEAAAEPAPLEPDNASSDGLDAQVAWDAGLAAELAMVQPEPLEPESEAQDLSDTVAPDTEDTAIETTAEAAPQPIQDEDASEQDPMLAGKKSKADIAVALMNKSATFFHTPGKEPYAMIWKGDHFEVWSVHSKDFELWIRYLYYQHTQSAMKKPDLATAIQEAEANALFVGPEMEVGLRIAQHEGAFYLDIGNARWEQVEITPDGWRVISLKDSRLDSGVPKGCAPFPIRSETVISGVSELYLTSRTKRTSA